MLTWLSNFWAVYVLRKPSLYKEEGEGALEGEVRYVSSEVRCSRNNCIIEQFKKISDQRSNRPLLFNLVCPPNLERMEFLKKEFLAPLNTTNSTTSLAVLVIAAFNPRRH